MCAVPRWDYSVGDGHPPPKKMAHEVINLLGGGFKYFVFSPRKLGKMKPF